MDAVDDGDVKGDTLAHALQGFPGKDTGHNKQAEDL